MSASAVMATMLLAGCSSLNNDNSVTKMDTIQAAQTAPVPQVDFRFSTTENFDLANQNKLSWRVFMTNPLQVQMLLGLTP
ncbi:hypothetical protein [Psychrobacter sp. WY6]|uniref:hypothetical protein n=1 Tax=Psychrobacter sp. WY6 TaxID=2708350 RepID=UPI002022FADD|nr:hypothetical protein [Psychrobacter sp. WY6]